MQVSVCCVELKLKNQYEGRNSLRRWLLMQLEIKFLRNWNNDLSRFYRSIFFFRIIIES